jgi:hypothetical protein
MTGPYRLTRPTAQPSSTGIPGCYRTDADDDGAACALCYSPDTQQTLMRNFPSCSGCVAGQWAAKIYYAQRGEP